MIVVIRPPGHRYEYECSTDNEVRRNRSNTWYLRTKTKNSRSGRPSVSAIAEGKVCGVNAGHLKQTGRYTLRAYNAAAPSSTPATNTYGRGATRW